MSKKAVRAAFRNAVFKRDRYTCRLCKKKYREDELDAHHITDRHEMPNGGYVPENGISLCEPCHRKAEEYHRTSGKLGLTPEYLYGIIGSSREIAVEASSRLCSD